MARIIEIGVTHLVIGDDETIKNRSNLESKFQLLNLSQQIVEGDRNPFKLAHIVMDFLRLSTLYKGRVLFVENENDTLVKECILIALNHIFKTGTYETYTLIKSQNLFFSIESDRLAKISKWHMNFKKIR